MRNPLPLILVAVLAVIATACAGRPDAAPRFDVYVGDAGHRAFTPIDPAFLADLPEAAPLPLAGPVWHWSFAGDGSAAASADNPTELEVLRGTRWPPTVVVRDPRTGAERSRFLGPAGALWPRLNGDGTRVTMARQGTAHDDWWVLDAADGRILGSGRADGWATGTWVSPNAGRLYRLITPHTWPYPNRPQALALSSRDALAPSPEMRLDLPDVPAGIWDGGRRVHPGGAERYPEDGVQVLSRLDPGLALSPDGRRLAVVSADADRVTMVDAERMAIERVVVPRRPGGIWDWLPLVPRPAHAKVDFAESAHREAVFGPEGRLYVWGGTSTVDDAGRRGYASASLRAGDGARGRVVGTLRTAARIVAVLPAPDGESLYALTSLDGGLSHDPQEAPHVLRRLDAATLVVLAEREILGYRRVVVLPG
jgi:hypothetical protein